MNGSVMERAGQPLAPEDSAPENPAPAATSFAPAATGLRRLATLHAGGPTVASMTALRATPLGGSVTSGFGFMRGRDDALQAMALIDEVVSDLPDPITAESIAPLGADFAAIHQRMAYGAAPSESGWSAGQGAPPPDPATLHCWRQLAGLAPDPGFPPDHLVPQLTLLATLLERGLIPEATRFLDQHPLRWIPEFCSRVATRCREPFYAGVAILTSAHLDHLRDLLAGACGLPRPPDDETDDTRRRRWSEDRLPRICGCDI